MPPLSHSTLEQVFNQLWEWCRARNFAGHDPFDALNSRRFQSLPFSNTRFLRLLWTQLVKRSPIDLRRIADVPADKNAKGIALFSLAALARHRCLKDSRSAREAQDLINQLLTMRLSGWNGAAWGYNFDWQSRYFFAPQGLPTIVPTGFAVRALIEAYDVLKQTEHLEVARTACDFVLKDLTRTVDSGSELCFSYAPNTSNQIFNANLFAGEILASVAKRTKEDHLHDAANRVVQFVIKHQRSDGSWFYGVERNQNWIDNFHTAFVLDSLVRIAQHSESTNSPEVQNAVARGYEFWRKRLFLADGWPKYYDDALYPADVHSAAAAIVTLCDLRAFEAERIKEPLVFAKQVTGWTIDNLRDREGYFYYQRKRFFTVRKPFMRWGEAWMTYALARMLEEFANAD